jgi:hypothetical protein
MRATPSSTMGLWTRASLPKRSRLTVSRRNCGRCLTAAEAGGWSKACRAAGRWLAVAQVPQE